MARLLTRDEVWKACDIAVGDYATLANRCSNDPVVAASCLQWLRADDRAVVLASLPDYTRSRALALLSVDQE